MFTQIDKDRSGNISKNEVRKFFIDNEVSLHNNELNELIMKLDADGDSNISVTEFKDIMMLEIKKGKM